MFKDRMPNAEELFPALVYLLIISNPDHIGMNLRYMDKFMSPARRIEKEGYIVANLSAALNFIQKLDSNELLKGKVQVKM